MLMKIFAASITLLIAGSIAVSASQRPTDSGGTTDKSGSPARSAEPSIQKLPAPTGKVVLRITGVTGGNAGTVTTADFATLDRIATERIKVREPFLKRDVTFNAVRMSDLLRAAGVPASATTLSMHALDDYKVDLPVAGVTSDGFMATRMNGKPMEIADGGPVRLVFTGSGRVAANTENWIWSTDSIRAR